MDFDAKKAYLQLFNDVSSAIGLIDAGKYDQAQKTLVLSQRITEEMYIAAAERFSKNIPFPTQKAGNFDAGE